jgi:hypothetical protein
MVPQAPPARTATAAAGRLSRATLAIGALGLLTALFMIDRLAETWRIGGHAAPAGHTISLAGQRLTYPVANVSAIAILLLAGLGFAITVRALAAAAREGVRSRRLVRRLGRRVSAERRDDGVHVIADPHPDALVAGLIKPRVYVTTGALALLDEDAVTAVLAHERHHVARHDPLRRAAGRVLTEALFVLPSLKRLADDERQLSELGADESALAAGRPALARALLAMEPHGGVDPVRVDRLLDETDGPGWLFPASLCAVALAALALLGLATALLAQTASGTATLSPPLLSRQPCILTLAGLPAAIAVILARCSRASVPKLANSWRIRARRSSRSR